MAVRVRSPSVGRLSERAIFGTTVQLRLVAKCRVGLGWLLGVEQCGGGKLMAELHYAAGQLYNFIERVELTCSCRWRRRRHRRDGRLLHFKSPTAIIQIF